MGAKYTFQVPFIFSCILLFGAMSTTSSLEVGYYKKTNSCPNAEKIVKGVVFDYVAKTPGLGAGLIRMFFHDCFVRGCDASILLDRSDKNPNPEKFAIPNFPSLRGFEVINDAKSALEGKCPGVVSCADIVAFAARDAALLLGGIFYKIPSGRFDGKVSNASEVLAMLPAPFHDLTKVKELFAAKNLSTEDMVVLSGAHSIGRSHCSSFTSRLYPNITNTMDQQFGLDRRIDCPQNASVDNVVQEDFITENVLDNKYYQNVVELKALFNSDWSLLTSTETAFLVERLRADNELFQKKFADAMVKMGNIIDEQTKSQGEIRKNCSAVMNP